MSDCHKSCKPHCDKRVPVIDPGFPTEGAIFVPAPSEARAIVTDMEKGMEMERALNPNVRTDLTVNLALPVSPTNFHAIQDAIDSFGDGQAGYTRITVAEGIYSEYLILQGFTSGNSLRAQTAIGLEIIGDERDTVPGMTYVNGYWNNGSARPGSLPPAPPAYTKQYFPATGTNYAQTKLLLNQARDEITIQMCEQLPIRDVNLTVQNSNGTRESILPQLEQPDFSDPSVDMRIGDRFILADADPLENYACGIHTITAINGNKITFVPPVPAPVVIPPGVGINNGAVDVSKKGASITFLPNVIITAPFPYQSSQFSIMSINNLNISMQGLHFDISPGFPASAVAAILANDTSIAVKNLICTDVTYKASSAFSLVNSKVFCGDWRTQTSVQASLNPNVSYLANSHFGAVGFYVGLQLVNSDWVGGKLFVSTSQIIGINVGANSGLSCWSMQVHGVQSFLKPFGAAALLAGINVPQGIAPPVYVQHIMVLTDCYTHCMILWGAKLHVNEPSVIVERGYAVTQGSECDSGMCYLSPGSEFNIYKGYPYQVDSEPRTQITFTSEFNDAFNVLPDGRQTPPYNNFYFPTEPTAAIYLTPNARFSSMANVKFNNCDYDYLIQGKESSVDTPKNEDTLNNIFIHKVDGPVSYVYEKQVLKKCVNVVLDPSILYLGGGDFGLYDQSSMLIYAEDAGKHYITFPEHIDVQGSISGKGIALKFEKQKCPEDRAYVRLTVTSRTTVLVEDSFGVVGVKKPHCGHHKKR